MLVLLLVVGSIAFGPIEASSVLPADYGEPIDRSLKEGGDRLMDAAATGNTTNGSQPTTTESEPTAGSTSSLDPARIEQLVHEYVNAERSARGRSNLSFDPALADIARYHSQDMAERDYFSHEAPDGETMADRYDRFGYDCRVSTGSNTYATGGENIGTIRFSGISPTEREIAEQIVAGWMASPGHRENLLRSYWEAEGIGVDVSSEGGSTRVYVTQNFC